MNERQRLEAGETVNIEGADFVKDDSPWQVGDLYIGQRNGGPRLLRFAFIRYEQNDGSYADTPAADTTFGLVYPLGPGYPFNEFECVKVKEARG